MILDHSSQQAKFLLFHVLLRPPGLILQPIMLKSIKAQYANSWLLANFEK